VSDEYLYLVFPRSCRSSSTTGTEADTVRRIQLLVDQHPRAERTIVALLRRRLDEVTNSSAA
jgi:hypothetical protein